MKRFLALTTAVVLSLSLGAGAQGSASTTKVVHAADQFLAMLTPEQRQKVLYAFNDAAQRARWSNFPTGVVPRGGISLKQMTAGQQDAAMKLMATVLSPMGMQKINEIRQADDDFKAHGSKRGPHGGGPRPGGPPQSAGAAHLPGLVVLAAPGPSWSRRLWW